MRWKQMIRKMKVVLVLTMTAILTLNVGCFGKGNDSKPTSANSETANSVNGISKQENEKAQKFISDYFVKLYSDSLENFMLYEISGVIYPGIKDMIAKNTLTIADGNPEVGLSYPRYVSMNGMTAISYELISKSKNKDDKFVADMSVNYVGEKSGSALYYVKVKLKAKCVPDDVFVNTIYKAVLQKPKLDKGDLTKAVAANKDNQTDFMKLQAKYDVEVKKEGDSYKIVTAKETNFKPGSVRRMFYLNNDFMERLSYLNTQKDGNTYADEEDGKTYDKEKGVILSFFNGLRSISNSENMKLLYPKWNSSLNDFKDIVRKLSSLYKNKDEKNIIDYMDLGNDYRAKFDYDSLLLHQNMEKTKGQFSNINVVLHPAYTQKQKRYVVTFEVPVELINGMIVGSDSVYKYDYFVTLSGNDKTLKVNSVRLNEFYKK